MLLTQFDFGVRLQDHFSEITDSAVSATSPTQEPGDEPSNASNVPTDEVPRVPDDEVPNIDSDGSETFVPEMIDSDDDWCPADLLGPQRAFLRPVRSAQWNQLHASHLL